MLRQQPRHSLYVGADLQSAGLKRALSVVLGFERAQLVLNFLYASPDFNRANLLSRRTVLGPKLLQLGFRYSSKEVTRVLSFGSIVGHGAVEQNEVRSSAPVFGVLGGKRGSGRSNHQADDKCGQRDDEGHSQSDNRRGSGAQVVIRQPRTGVHTNHGAGESTHEHDCTDGDGIHVSHRQKARRAYGT